MQPFLEELAVCSYSIARHQNPFRAAMSSMYIALSFTILITKNDVVWTEILIRITSYILITYTNTVG